MEFNTEDKVYKEQIEIEYKSLELRLEQLHKKKSRKTLVILGGLITFGFSSIFFGTLADAWYYKNLILAAIIAIVVGSVLACSLVFLWVSFIESEENRTRREMLKYESENIQAEVKEDIFENSIKMSYKYLDQYYDQTREQAQRGFKVTVYVASFGAVLIGVGIIAMFFGKSDPAVITCASGVVTEFISTIFFYLYNRTVTSMSNYHNKLVLSQNISIALKVSDTLPEKEKNSAKNQIITELLKDINSYLIRSDIEGEKKENSKN